MPKPTPDFQYYGGDKKLVSYKFPISLIKEIKKEAKKKRKTDTSIVIAGLLLYFEQDESSRMAAILEAIHGKET